MVKFIQHLIRLLSKNSPCLPPSLPPSLSLYLSMCLQSNFRVYSITLASWQIHYITRLQMVKYIKEVTYYPCNNSLLSRLHNHLTNYSGSIMSINI